MAIQELNLDDKEAPRKTGYWRRQFQLEATSRQKIFDWIFGVILPVICVAADPIVFKDGHGDRPLLWMFKPFAYVLSFVSIMAMLAWLLWGPRLRELNSILAGLFFFGSLVSLAVGFILLPFSLIGLVIGIGALGFTPLFATFVYLRNAVRTFHRAEVILERRVLIGSFVLSAIFSAVIPWTINLEVDAHRPFHRQWFSHEKYI